MARGKAIYPCYTAVSLEGTSTDREIINRIAANRGIRTGRLTRVAIQAFCTQEEWDEAARFVAEFGSQSNQPTPATAAAAAPAAAKKGAA